jgi:hypothetical protein
MAYLELVDTPLVFKTKLSDVAVEEEPEPEVEAVAEEPEAEAVAEEPEATVEEDPVAEEPEPES